MNFIRVTDQSIATLGHAKAILLGFIRRETGDGEFRPIENKDIAKYMNVCTRQGRRMLAELVETGKVEVKYARATRLLRATKKLNG